MMRFADLRPGRRMTAWLLVVLFGAAAIQPAVASFGGGDTCGMACCRRGAHKEACCCKKKSAADAGGAPAWKTLPPCPPNCARTVLSFPSTLAPAVTLRQVSAAPLRAVRHSQAPIRTAPMTVVVRQALFQRPPPSLS